MDTLDAQKLEEIKTALTSDHDKRLYAAGMVQHLQRDTWLNNDQFLDLLHKAAEFAIAAASDYCPMTGNEMLARAFILEALLTDANSSPSQVEDVI